MHYDDYNALWTKTNSKSEKKYFQQSFFALKLARQNPEMSDEEHSDSEFYYPEEQETAERKASRRGRHFDKVETSGDTGMKR